MKNVISHLLLFCLLSLSSLFAQPGTPGKVGAEFRANTDTLNDQWDSDVVMHKDGSFVIVWQSESQDGNLGGIYGQRYDAAGNKAGSEFRANATVDSNQANPTIGMHTNGDYLIAWESSGQDGGGKGIYAKKYYSTGSAASLEFRVNTTTAGNQMSPSAWTNGASHHVVYQSENIDGGGHAIAYQILNGTTQISESQVNTYTTDNQTNPSMSLDSAGRGVVVWQSNGQDGSGEGIYGQRYNLGAKVGGEFRVNTYTAGNQMKPSVSVNRNGAFIVVWQSFGQDGSGYGIYAQRFDSLGNKIGGEFSVNTYTDNDQIVPSAGLYDDGSFVVVWSSFNQDGSDSGIFGRRFDRFGLKIGGEFQVNSYANQGQDNAAFAVNRNGQCIATWESNGQDGSLRGVYGQRYTTRVNDNFAVFLPDTIIRGPSVLPGDTISLPVYADSLSYNFHTGIRSFQFVLSYSDSAFHYVGVDTEGTLLSNFGGLQSFTIEERIELGAGTGALPDCVLIAGASNDSTYYPIVPGTAFDFPRMLCKLRFAIPENFNVGHSGDFRFGEMYFNEGVPTNVTRDGSVLLELSLFGDIDQNGIIQPYDAVLVLRSVVRDTVLSSLGQYAAEVSGNERIMAYDAALILMRYVGSITEFPVGSFFKGLLPSNGQAELALAWGEAEDGFCTLLVNAENLDNVYAYSMEIAYDPSTLTFEGGSHTDFTRTMISAVHDEGGRIRMAAAGTEPIYGSGALAMLKFRITGETMSENAVRLTELTLNEEIVLSNPSFSAIPNTYSLGQNFPNPFNPTTSIRYQIPEAAQVQITIYNLLGQRVRTLVNEAQPAGAYDIMWDGTNDSGAKLASGVYIYQMKAGGFAHIRKLIFMK